MTDNAALNALVEGSAASTSQTASGTNASAVITIGASTSGQRNIVDGVVWSYSAAPTGGRLTIADGVAVVFDEDITGPGAGFFPVYRRGSANTQLVVTLYAGGSGIVGKVNIAKARLE